MKRKILTLASKFIETELNAYITNQRLIPQDNLVRLIAKAFEAYDEYKRLVSVNNDSKRCKHGMLKDYSCQSCIDDYEVSRLNPRINQKLDQIDNDLYSCPDLDQDKTDPTYSLYCPHGWSRWEGCSICLWHGQDIQR